MNETEKNCRAQFGVTDDLFSGGFILENGDLLDLSYGQGYRIEDHRIVGGCFPDDYEHREHALGDRGYILDDFSKETNAIRYGAYREQKRKGPAGTTMPSRDLFGGKYTKGVREGRGPVCENAMVELTTANNPTFDQKSRLRQLFRKCPERYADVTYDSTGYRCEDLEQPSLEQLFDSLSRCKLEEAGRRLEE